MENVLAFLSISRKPFPLPLPAALLSPAEMWYLLRSAGCSVSAQIGLPWQCSGCLKLAKDLKVWREVSGQGSKDLHGGSGCLKTWVGRLNINRGTGSIICTPTNVLPKSRCVGWGSILLKVQVYNIKGVNPTFKDKIL